MRKLSQKIVDRMPQRDYAEARKKRRAQDKLDQVSARVAEYEANYEQAMAKDRLSIDQDPETGVFHQTSKLKEEMACAPQRGQEHYIRISKTRFPLYFVQGRESIETDRRTGKKIYTRRSERSNEFGLIGKSDISERIAVQGSGDERVFTLGKPTLLNRLADTAWQTSTSAVQLLGAMRALLPKVNIVD